MTSRELLSILEERKGEALHVDDICAIAVKKFEIHTKYLYYKARVHGTLQRLKNKGLIDNVHRGYWQFVEFVN